MARFVKPNTIVYQKTGEYYRSNDGRLGEAVHYFSCGGMILDVLAAIPFDKYQNPIKECLTFSTLDVTRISAEEYQASIEAIKMEWFSI